MFGDRIEDTCQREFTLQMNGLLNYCNLKELTNLLKYSVHNLWTVLNVDVYLTDCVQFYAGYRKGLFYPRLSIYRRRVFCVTLVSDGPAAVWFRDVAQHFVCIIKYIVVSTTRAFNPL